jgi:uncharacterized protein (DUF952 family)
MSASCSNRLFHAALPEEWADAQAAGLYDRSTRGRSLVDEGFIHASYENQVERVVNSFYADLDELVLLEVDRERLDVEVVDESPTGDPADEHFPHLYGPLPVSAVAAATSWHRESGQPWRLPTSLNPD